MDEQELQRSGGLNPRVSRLAVVGAGKWGTILIRTIVSSPHLELAAVVSSQPAEHLQKRGAFAAPVLARYEDLAAHAHELDGVVLATPPQGRARQVDYFLNLGIPVFAEKPLTLAVDETRRLVAKARELGVPLVEDFVHLYAWPYRTIRDHVAGKRVRIESCGGNDGPVRDYGPLHDYGPHDVAMALHIFGRRPDNISASVFEYRSPLQYCVRSELDFGAAGQAIISIGNSYPSKRRTFVVSAADDEWVYDDLSPNKLTRAGVPVVATYDPPLTYALNSFVGREPLVAAASSEWLSESVAEVLDSLSQAIAPLLCDAERAAAGR